MPTDWDNIKVREEEKTPPPARLLPGRFPLLWVLLPLIAAYLAAESPGRIPDTMVWVVGVLVSGLALGVVFIGRAYALSSRIFAVAFPIGVFPAGLLFHSFACPLAPDRSALPPREAILTVRVDELFSSRFDAVSGVGTVADAPAHLAELTGTRIQFRVTKH